MEPESNDIASRFHGLPGAELVTVGLKDLSDGVISEHSLLLMVAAPALERLGLDIPKLSIERPYEHCLYALLEAHYGESAYSRYNSLRRRIVSFARCLEGEKSRAERKRFRA